MDSGGTRQFLEQRFARDAAGAYRPHQPVYGIESGEPGQLLRLARTLRLLAVLDALAPSSVLDLGAAEGYIANLVRLRSGCPVLCSDLSLEACHRAAELHGLPAIAGDLTALPLRPGCADVVLLSEVFEHLPDPASALRAAFRYARRYVVLTTQERCNSRLEQAMRLALADPDEPHGERNWLTLADLRALFGERPALLPQFRRSLRRLLEHVPREDWAAHVRWLATPHGWRSSEGVIAVIAAPGMPPPRLPELQVDEALLAQLISGPPVAAPQPPPWDWLEGAAPPDGLVLDWRDRSATWDADSASSPWDDASTAEQVLRRLHIPAQRPPAWQRSLYTKVLPLMERLGYLTCDDPLSVKLARLRGR